MVDGSKKQLAKNTAFLYILTFSSQLLSIVTIPYQTRVLSPETYGVLGVAISVMTVLSLVLDFGMVQSLTPGVAAHSNDTKYLSRLYTEAFLGKAAMGAVCFAVLLIAVACSSYMRAHAMLYVLYFAAYMVGALLPDYLYRGMEQMKIITVRTVAIRCFATAMIFVFMRSDADILVMPLCLLVGNAVAVAVCFRYDRAHFGVGFTRVRMRDVCAMAKLTFPFFVSRIASTVYSVANPFVLNMFYSGGAVVGFYSASEKFLSVSKSVVAPVADSLYPYMVKRKDFALVRKVLCVAMPVIIVGAAVLFVFADQVCAFLFGAQYAQAGDIVRCLIPAMVVIFPSYVMCFPVLVPMGLSKQANASNLVGLASQLSLLALLVVSGNLTVHALCIATSVSELLVFAYRCAVVYRHRDFFAASPKRRAS